MRRIDEHFGSTPIGEVTAAQIRAEHTRIRRDGSMSEHAIHKMHQKMKQIMQQAVYDELIPKNPCDPVKAPRPKSKERKSLSREEAARLYAILIDGPLEAPRIAVLLGLATGMRMGEVLGEVARGPHPEVEGGLVASRGDSARRPRPQAREGRADDPRLGPGAREGAVRGRLGGPGEDLGSEPRLRVSGAGTRLGARSGLRRES